MKPFVVSRYGHLVLPLNFFPEPNFSTTETVADLDAVIRRDFEAKHPRARKSPPGPRRESTLSIRASTRSRVIPVVDELQCDGDVREAVDTEDWKKPILSHDVLS